MESGYTTQVACPGCTACSSSQEPQSGTEVVEMGRETLADLQRAADAIRGLPHDPPMSSEIAWGLIVSYLPALVEMSRQWMLAQETEPATLRISAHQVFESGL